jgi:hypothetical protein
MTAIAGFPEVATGLLAIASSRRDRGCVNTEQRMGTPADWEVWSYLDEDAAPFAVDEGTREHCEHSAAARNATLAELGLPGSFAARPVIAGTRADRSAPAGRVRRYGLRRGQRRRELLAALADSPGLHGSALATAAELEKSGVSRLLRELEAEGLVARTVGPGGGHAWHATSAGLRMLDTIQ